MKKLTLFIFLILSAVYCRAQGDLAFPFQGGNQIYNRFFKDSLSISPEIVKKRAAGTAIFKFTADISGNIQKIVIYYADDYLLTMPLINVLKKSTKKWIIPNKEIFHDFIIPFSVNFNTPVTNLSATRKTAYEYYLKRKPILTTDQLPLNAATLLPTVVVTYDVK